MKKRVVIVHGWDGTPTDGWFLWLTKELVSKGFEVVGPQLPDADEPRVERWVPALAQAVGTPDEQTYFIGHSMGCQTIARYLEFLPEGTKVGGAVFVAGFFKRLTGLEEEEGSEEIGRQWLEAPLDLSKVRSHLPKSIAIFSDNDPFVPLDNQDDFRNKLGSEIIIQKRMGHFSGSGDGILELPIALESLLKIAQ
jgi:hypothetical protein